ncbi:MAG TPA: hypothetical protein DCS06_03155 [Candidatus Yanofskybacteria bacterium]|nr:hypothetical protein [Candidatus Yanofskybacteria bacterium]HBT80565.1 hypothetical protein [Candidatus Yanofskybacteria bacterium]HBX58510.1 hypothetical protein [Candidatus Yanofskybacteria bacterium]
MSARPPSYIFILLKFIATMCT